MIWVALKRYVCGSLKFVSCLRFVTLIFKNMHLGAGEREGLNGSFIDFCTPEKKTSSEVKEQVHT